MTKFLIDSDIVIWFLKGRDKETKLLEELSTKGVITMSAITITEVRAGLQKNATRIIKELKKVLVPVDLNSEMAELAGSFKQKYNLGIADMLIGATATLSGCTLVTYNKKHFPMRQVKLYKF